MRYQVPYLEELAKHYRQKYDDVDGEKNWTDLLKVRTCYIKTRNINKDDCCVYTWEKIVGINTVFGFLLLLYRKSIELRNTFLF